MASSTWSKHEKEGKKTELKLEMFNACEAAKKADLLFYYDYY